MDKKHNKANNKQLTDIYIVKPITPAEVELASPIDGQQLLLNLLTYKRNTLSSTFLLAPCAKEENE